MKITVKVKVRAGKKPASIVRERLKKARAKATVEEVFPGQTSGRRAGMVSVDLAGDLSDKESQSVLDALRADGEIEYAEPARQRKPKK
jgi:hypothetical protein